MPNDANNRYQSVIGTVIYVQIQITSVSGQCVISAIQTRSMETQQRYRVMLTAAADDQCCSTPGSSPFWWTSTCKFHVFFSSPLSGHPSPVCQRHYANYGSIHSHRFIHRCPTLFSCKMSTYVIWCTDTNPIGLTNKHAATHRLVEYIVSVLVDIHNHPALLWHFRYSSSGYRTKLQTYRSSARTARYTEELILLHFLWCSGPCRALG